MKRIFAVASLFFLLPVVVYAQPTPSKVLIVYNTNYAGDDDSDGVQDSLQVAQYYAQKRGVPSQNLLGISFPNPHGIDNFSILESVLLQPVKTKLSALGPTNIDVILMSHMTPLLYAEGRDTYYNTKQSVSIDNILMALNYWKSSPGIRWMENPTYFERTPTIGTDLGRFNHSYKYANTDIYLVTRLAGPGGVWRVLDLVDQALYGERYATLQPGYLHGIAYVDSQNRVGNYTAENLLASQAVQTGNYGATPGSNNSGTGYNNTDQNIAYTHHYVLSKGYPLKWENSGEIIGRPSAVFHDGASGQYAPRAFLYGGWYAYNNYIPNWEWLPGSVGTDLNSSSFSWSIYNGGTLAWGTRALAEGLTAASGVVSEPYTIGAPRPNNLIYYILQGFTFAEAASLATPSYGWMPLSIGDPLYAPFKAKTPVRDTYAPKLLPGYPRIAWNAAEGHVLEAFISDSPEPEAASVTLQYGTTSAFGSSQTLKAFYRRPRLPIPDLQASTTYNARAILTDAAGNVTTSSPFTFTTPPQTPYAGAAPSSIPGTILLWQFDEGGEGIAYHDSRPDKYVDNQRRNNTGVEVYHVPPHWVFQIDPGEWLEYTVNITQAGSYTAKVKTYDFCGSFHLEINGTNVSGKMTATAYSGDGTVTKSGINLPAGQHVLRVAFDERACDNFGNLESLQFVYDGGSSSDNLPPAAPEDLRIVN